MRYVKFNAAGGIELDFGSPQDSEYWPGLQEVSEDDPLYIAAYAQNIAAQVKADRDNFLQEAALRIAPLQDAVDLESATAEEVALLKLWKKYRVDLSRIEQQVGFPNSVTWPVAPST